MVMACVYTYIHTLGRHHVCHPLGLTRLSLHSHCMQASHAYDFTSSVSIADALDDHPLGQRPFSLAPPPCDVSLRSVQVVAVGYTVEALKKRNLKLATSILTHIVCPVSPNIHQWSISNRGSVPT